jgi:hypothetical protein
VIGSLDRITGPATATADEAAGPLSRLVHRTQAMGGRLEIHVDAPERDAAAA